MAITLRVHAKATFSAIGTININSLLDNFPHEPATPTLGVIFSYTTTGVPASLSINWEGSQNGTSGWTTIGVAQTNTTSGSVTMLAPIFPYVRVNLTAIAGGTAPTVICTNTTQGGN